MKSKHSTARKTGLMPPIHIVGAGGIGVSLAWSLLQAGHDVTLVDANPEKVARGTSEGLTVVGHGTVRAPFVAFDEWNPPASGYILICTKTYDNPIVIERLTTDACLVPVQNGVDPELEKLNHAGEGISSFVSECDRSSPVTRITRPGELHIGTRRSASAKETGDLALLADALAGGKLFRVRYVDNILPYKSAKLMYNAAISPLAAAAGVDNGELLTDSLATRLFFALLRENYAILHHCRVELARIGPFHPKTVSRILSTPLLPYAMALFFRPSLKGTYCSMAPDIATGRTEVDAYNGHLIRIARDFPCPINRAACSMVREIASGTHPIGRENFSRLAEALPAGVLR
ncbi:MAG: FAD-dependent oxidoreductase [Alphaproteobacteria bacterium]